MCVTSRVVRGRHIACGHTQIKVHSRRLELVTEASTYITAMYEKRWLPAVVVSSRFSVSDTGPDWLYGKKFHDSLHVVS